VENLTFDPLTANIGINTITASFTDVNGCQGAAILNITVEECANLLEADNDYIQILPNPSRGEFVIGGLKGIAKVQITDFNGKIIFSKSDFNEKDKIDLSHNASGAYFVEINRNENETINKKLFLIK